MITLTFCRMFPQALGTRAKAIALVQTTYTNSVRTTNMASLLTALKRPVLIPLLYLTIWLSPLIWFSNFMSYPDIVLRFYPLTVAVSPVAKLWRSLSL
jgi:hypothetical protein